MAAFVYQMNPWVEYEEPGMGWSMMMGLSASDWIETRLSVVDLFVLFQRIAMRMASSSSWPWRQLFCVARLIPLRARFPALALVLAIKSRRNKNVDCK
jgi:hypothetical protein